MTKIPDIPIPDPSSESAFGPESFGRIWAAIYDKLYSDRNDLAVLTNFLAARANGGPVLEFGVGTGRTAQGLVEAGFEVHGIDRSHEMLDILASKPFADRIHVVHGDFTSVDLERKFNLVFIVFGTLFMLDSQEAQLAAVANAARHLAEDGRLVIECFVPDLSRWMRGQTSFVSGLDDKSVDFLVATHDPINQIVRNQHVFISSNAIKLRPLQLRYAFPTEIDLMARAAGLHRAERYGGYAEEPFTANSTHHVSVYRRPTGQSRRLSDT